MAAKSSSLALEDGTVYKGVSFGAPGTTYGEVVFNTSMTGYQEMLTDPSYAGQIVVLTYPLIGNYGINKHDFESLKIQVAGFVVRSHSAYPSHQMSTSTLGKFLESQGVVAISGLDTRAIARRLRSKGVMMGAITIDSPLDSAVDRELDQRAYGQIDYVDQVSTKDSYLWPLSRPAEKQPKPKYRIVVTDCGLKFNILRLLYARKCEVIAVPAMTSASDILKLNPDGVLLSPGPGNPELLNYSVETAKGLIGTLPIMGICLGNQVLGRALGGKTFKLKFGHRGGNHPVIEKTTRRVYITAQNHGYAVDGDSLPPEVEISHINLNDGTVEGLRHKFLPVIGIQYHSEASPGPRDNEYIFDQFISMVDEASNGTHR